MKMTGPRLLISTICMACSILILPIHSQAQELSEPVTTHYGSFETGRVMNAPLLQFGQSRKSVIRVLKKPAYISTVEFPNIHNPDVLDRIYKLVYKDVEVEIYEATQSGTEFLWSVVLTRNMSRITYGIRMGASPEEIERLLGSPEEKRKDTYIYPYMEENDSGPDTLIFTVKKKALVKICWEYFLD